MSEIEVVHGDALEVLRFLPDGSFDAMITDPPAGIGFMGKAWDGDKGGRDAWVAWLSGVMSEALRVLKPGAHALVWALPRTSHWTAWALEGAGFDVRDRVSHLFGTGFPKSLDIGKAIDGALGAKREVVGANPNHRAVSGVEYAGIYAGGNTGASIVTAAASEAAKQWDGWGTALKPACEDWWLVRKPLDGTYAENVLTHGVGGINVDACRLPSSEDLARKPALVGETTAAFGRGLYMGGHGEKDGRWPSNVVLDPTAAAEIDESSPPSASHKGKPRGAKTAGPGWGMTATGAEYADQGGPSRFFYVAKPSTAEREAGLEDLPLLSAGQLTGRDDDTDGLNSPRAGAGRGGGRRNVHPTVKSLDLMEYLIRLITPPGGLVLDPFCGSGSTLAAVAWAGTWDALGIEQEATYIEIARRRIKYWAGRSKTQQEAA